MYKTLTRLAKTNRSIPILGQIKVQDGVATSSDIDFWISVPTQLADGMYHGEGFEKNINLKSDLPIEDFPDPVNHKKQVASVMLPFSHKDALEWVMKAASTEPARYYLNGCFFDWTEETGYMVCTDGHRLHLVKHDIEAQRPKKKMEKQRNGKKKLVLPTTGAILQTRSMKIIIDLIKELKTEDVHITFYETTFVATIGPAQVEGKLVDGTFPDWRRVRPDHDRKNNTVFDPVQINRILPELKAMTKVDGRKTPAIQVGRGQIKTAASFSCKTKEWPCTVDMPLRAGFNANYLAQICPGRMFYKDIAEPFVVEGWPGEIEKIGIIMPLRV